MSSANAKSAKSGESQRAASRVKTYERTRVLTARPEDLQLMLYDGLQRFCERARLALETKDREAACNCLDRARQIVLYLSEGLRPEVAPELCALVASSYMFVYRRLVDAALHGSMAALDEAIGVVRGLRDCWAELLAQRSTKGQSTREVSAESPRLRVTG